MLIAGALAYFVTRQSKAGIPLLALILSMIALWAFALPRGTGTIALYGALVITALAGAFNSKSRYIEIGAIILASLFALSNFVWVFTNQDNTVRIVPIINGLAAIYFFWQAVRPKAQQKAFHLILAICQATTLAMSYFHLLTSAIPAAAEISSNWMFTFAINRLFDIQILLVIVSSRFRVHARKNLSAWTLWQEEFFELYAKVKSILGLGQKPRQD
ncbi:MAG: hypothetical protein AAF936_14785 [Pseudomonadota bacterium]